MKKLKKEVIWRF